MAGRTLCDTTKLSKRLSLATPTSFGLYPYIFQETCDYGRLDTNPYLIKAQRFPLIAWVTPELIEKAIQEYNSPQIAILFLWEFDGHRYGYFVNFEARSGKHLSRRRKSPIPEPPADILSKWLQDNNRFKTVQTVQNCSYKLSQFNSSQIKKDIKDITQGVIKSINPPKEHLIVVRDTWNGLGIPDFNYAHIEKLQQKYAIPPEKMVKLIEKQANYLKSKSRDDRRSLWEDMCKSPAKYL